jgi:tetratricopeptide (TPR) repeat protein
MIVQQLVRGSAMFVRLTITALVIAPSAVAFGQSETGKVYLFNGQTITGKFNELTRDKIVVAQPPGAPKQYAINEVKFIQIPGEPKDLMDVRQATLRGQYDHVIETIGKIPPAELKSDQVRREVDFYRALAMARMAEAGSGDPAAAGKALLAWVTANKDSHHYYDANEAAGDLLVSMQRFELAPRYYTELAAAPWPDAKMRAAIAIGRSLQAQNKHAEAVAQFDEATKIDAKGKAAETLILAARIGKAKSTVAVGKADEGVKVLNELIDAAAVDNVTALAMAYNALGDAYLKLGKPKEALFAYMHTDLLYNQTADLHAEALYHLKDLHEKDNHPERAKEVADTLKTRYASSRWNK